MRKIKFMLLIIVILTLFNVNITASDLYSGDFREDNPIIQPEGLWCDIWGHETPYTEGTTFMNDGPTATYCSRSWHYHWAKCPYCWETVDYYVDSEVIVYHHFHVTSIVPAGNKNLVTYTCIYCSYSYSALELP